MSTDSKQTKPVIIVGAGLAGLVCALRLRQAAVPILLLEQSDRVGGRVRTERKDGFRLDRGFQVFLTSYPEAQRWLNMDELQLGRFQPGACIRWQNTFHRFSDPLRVPGEALASMVSPVASLGDKIRMLKLRLRLAGRGYGELFEGSDQSTLQGLRAEGFSDRVIERFFRPFMGGIFLDPSLQTSWRMFEFVFGMFSRGPATLPADGMGAIPAQLADQLSPESLRFNTRVASIEDGSVRLDDGTRLDAAAVVLAGLSAAGVSTDEPDVDTVETTCLYFAADAAPYEDATLVLNGEGTGPINNVAVLTNANPAYSDDGRALVSVTVLQAGQPSDADLLASVQQQLQDWWASAASWQHLETVRVVDALPSQPPGHLEPKERPVRRGHSLYICGDHIDNASIQGAMVSGRRAAEAILSDGVCS